MNYYQESPEKVLEELRTTESGLSHQEAGDRLAKCGPNKLAEGKKVIAVELDSPKDADLTGYMDGARRLQRAGVDAVTIADCPIARARVDAALTACKLRRELGLVALPHMTCRDRNLNAAKALLLGLYAEGVREVLAITGDPIPTAERDEDSFLKYYDPHHKARRTKNERSCQLKGARVPEGRLKIIEGIMPVKEVLRLSKSYNTTLTVLLTSMMLIAFAQEIPLRKKKRPVVLDVPVNLRNYFQSETARNFFGVIKAGYNFSQGPGTLEEVIAHVREVFARELTAEQLGARMAALSKAEHNLVTRAIPLVLKDPILRIANAFNESCMAGSISNIGKVTLPEAAVPFVNRFDVFVSTDKLQACVCSFGSQLTVSFTSAFRSTNVQKNFFRQLTQAGIPVEIQSNKLEDDLR